MDGKVWWGKTNSYKVFKKSGLETKDIKDGIKVKEEIKRQSTVVYEYLWLGTESWKES